MISSKKKKIKLFAILLFAVFFVVVTVCVIIVSQKEMPTEDLRLARLALSEAKEAEADVYSDKDYKESLKLYESAMRRWSQENNRFILFRDYTGAITFARKSRKLSDEAKEESIKKAANLSKDVESSSSELDRKIELYNKLFKNLPLPKSVFDAHNKSKMFLSESKIAYQAGKLKDAQVLFKKAEIYVNHANTAAGKMLRDYFDGYSRWRSLADGAIAASRGGGKVILVDKVAHVLYVYQSGKVFRSYDVEFGPNWMAHKVCAGDRATPEGNYHVTSEKHGNSAYHKALLIDYPNAEDRRNFAMSKKQGLISRGSGIGNLIEIHGGGGRGFDWTVGCVGLRDRDIDDLCRYVGPGTRVTIVGSLQPLSVITGGANF